MSDHIDTPATLAGTISAKRSGRRLHPFYWSVRRELWENRSLTLAPMAVAVLVLLGFLIGAIHLPDRLREAVADPAGGSDALARPYELSSILIMLTTIVIGMFYCLDALYGERRDRSILFWKSLPVSDITAVLAKASIPLVVLPLIAYATILAIQMAMLLIGIVVVVLHGLPVAPLWTAVPLFQMSVALLYGFATLALWHAPIYAWLLLVSAWARRTPLLWAVLPPLAVCAVEGIALGSWHLTRLLGDRLIGSFLLAFDLGSHPGETVDQPLAHLEPERFFSSVGLWIGLVASVILLAMTIRLRRGREAV